MKISSRTLCAALATCLLLSLSAANAHAQTVLITGSNTGIGLEFARQYAERGWTVIATHRRDSEPDSLVALRDSYPDSVQIEYMDVSDYDGIDALAEKLRGQPIDVLLNNASLIRFAPLNDPEGNAGQMFGTLDYDHFDQFMTVNVAGPLKVAEAFVEHVKASEHRQIINISSRAGMITQPGGSDHYWYRISKTALNQGMRLVAVELEDDGVTVVMFHPGGVQVESFGDLQIPGALTPEEAISRMLAVIDDLTVEDTGRFLQNDGSDHPW